MKSLYIIICFVPLLFACQTKEESQSEEEIGYELAGTPTGEENVTVSGKEIKVDFSLDEGMAIYITSEYGLNTLIKQKKLADINTRRELIDFYNSLPTNFKPGYSSSTDYVEFVFAKVEYLLSRECFQIDCPSRIRKEILQIALEKQKQKYGTKYVSPMFTRRTGIFLIAVILLLENDSDFIDSLSDPDMQQSLLCLNHNIWVDDGYLNSLMIQFAENHLSN